MYAAFLIASSLVRADAPDFEKQILPILKANCFACHDAKKGKAELRLDLRARAFKGGDSGKPAITPRDLAKSELYARVVSKDEEAVMPPEKPLNPAEISLLKAWIEAGADWPDKLAGDENANRKHWAFQPVVRPALPVSDGHPIDRFVRERLAKEKLQPSPKADKVTLLRRLHLDLTGLPPTAAEVDAFLKDTSPEAYAKQVNRLLASTHYGERWGRLWLDAARYADSDGFEKDKPRFVHFYRDWVVDALNRDLPYNQFLVEQLAGDLLPNATQDQIVATGFLRNSMINEEGGVDPEQFRMEAMFDRMDAVGKAVLGLTIQCAQCHDHKFDPISQKEYYRLFAFLNNSHEASSAVYTDEEQKKRYEILAGMWKIEEELKKKHPDWKAKQEVWEKQQLAKAVEWKIVRPELDTSGGQKHYLLEDGSILAAGYAPTKHSTEFNVKLNKGTIRAVRLEMLNDPSLPKGGPGRSIHGLFALSEFHVTVNEKGKKRELAIASAYADANPEEKELDAQFDDKSGRKRITGGIALAIDRKPDTAWSQDIGAGRSNVPRVAVFVLKEPLEIKEPIEIVFKMQQNHGGYNSDDNQNNNLGRFRLGVTDSVNAKDDLLPESTKAMLTQPGEHPSLFVRFREAWPEAKEANAKIEALLKTHPSGSTQLVYEERGDARPTHMLKRGDFLRPAEMVSAGVPAVLNPVPESKEPDRLRFAKWATDPKSPTTARSIVNRVWQAYFGIGLVPSSEDLGTQSEKPSHPELLDWLAAEFMEQGWSLKKLHRLIVSSETYQQTSKLTPELLEKDPNNRLLARSSRFRVDAELVRDIALFASGLLNPKLGGPSVYPPLPDFLMKPPVSYGPKVWKEETGADRYRRALYTFRFRSVPYPALQTFDAPVGDCSTVRRTRSNTPLQALVGLNEPLFVECAQNLGLKALKAGDKLETQLMSGFRACVSREPTKDELATLTELYKHELVKFLKQDAKPFDVCLAKPEDAAKLPNHATPAQWAAMTMIARVLLNLDETITRE